MLKYIKVKNFLSFKEETEINFESSLRGKKDNVFKIGNDVLMKNMLIYGANASGKSNIIRVLQIIKYIATENNFSKNLISPFLLDIKTKEEASFFEICFFIDEREFIYNFELFDGKIFSENLKEIKFTNKEYREDILFTRKLQDIKAGEGFEKELEKGKDKVKENSSIIAVLSEWNGKIAGYNIDYFFNKISFLDNKFESEKLSVKLLEVEKNKKSKKFLLNFLQFSDFNIEDIKIEKKPFDSDLIEYLNKKSDLDNIIKERIINEGDIEVRFGHKVKGINELAYFNLNTESDGTRKLFSILGPIVDSIFNEGILFIDEIENRLHLHILQEIIKLINSDIQGKKYQFFFTTHNISLMDLNVLKKEQIGIVEKNKNGESEFYTLYDFDKVREGRDIQKYFNAGAYGGVPNLLDFKSLLNNFELGEENEK